MEMTKDPTKRSAKLVFKRRDATSSSSDANRSNTRTAPKSKNPAYDDWHFATKVGPFHVVEKPDTAVVVACRTKDPGASRLVRFVPASILYDPNNYTESATIDVHTRVSRDVMPPEIECASNSSLVTDVQAVVGERETLARKQPREVSWASVGATILLGFLGGYYLFWVDYRKKQQKERVKRRVQRPNKNRERKLRGRRNNNRKPVEKSRTGIHKRDDDEHHDSQKETSTFSFKDYWIGNTDDEDSSGSESDTDSKVHTTDREEDLNVSRSKLKVLSKDGNGATAQPGEWHPVERKAKSHQSGTQSKATYTTFRFKREKKKVEEPSPTSSYSSHLQRIDTPPALLLSENESSPEGAVLWQNAKPSLSLRSSTSTTETMLFSPNAASIVAPVPTVRFPFWIFVEGMVCGGCATTVANALEEIDGVFGASVDLVESTAKVWSTSPRLDLAHVVEALATIGMKAYLIPGLQAPHQSITTDASPGTIYPVPIGRAPTRRQTSSNTLELMDELQQGTVRRYKCGCGCETCICSDKPIREGDVGQDISLHDFCDRLERTQGLTGLEAKILAADDDLSNNVALRDKLSKLSIPCGCSSMTK